MGENRNFIKRHNYEVLVGMLSCEIPREDRVRIYEIVRKRLPKRAVLLILSHTGSRAFGWGSQIYDIDVRGIYAYKGWFDWVHIGYDRYDIGLYELSHLFSDIEMRCVPTFYDLAKPFYIHPDFDYETFLSFFSAENIKMHMYSIRLERKRFELNKHPRSALHCYKERLIPLYWLKTGRIEVNIWKINELFNLKMLPILANAYAKRKSIDIDWRRVEEELDLLEKMLEEELVKNNSKLDVVKYLDWKRRMEETFYEKYGAKLEEE